MVYFFSISIGDYFTLGEDGAAIADSQAVYGSLGALFSTLLPNIFLVANIILFFFILMGGFMIITNGGNPEKQQQGSKILTNALIGFAIVFTSYWIMQMISYLLGYNILNPPGLPTN